MHTANEGWNSMAGDQPGWQSLSLVPPPYPYSPVSSP